MYIPPDQPHPQPQKTLKKPPTSPQKTLVNSSLASHHSQVIILKTYTPLSLEVQHSLENFCRSKILPTPADLDLSSTALTIVRESNS